jgi:hypothetical protein
MNGFHVGTVYNSQYECVIMSPMANNAHQGSKYLLLLCILDSKTTFQKHSSCSNITNLFHTLYKYKLQNVNFIDEEFSPVFLNTIRRHLLNYSAFKQR